MGSEVKVTRGGAVVDASAFLTMCGLVVTLTF